MAWGTAIAAIGGSLISGLMSQDSADEVSDASRASVAEQRRQFNQLMEFQEPYRDVGRNALYQQAAMMGMGSPERQRMEEELSNLREEFQGINRTITTGGETVSVEGTPGKPAHKKFVPETTEINPEWQRRQQEIEQLEQDLAALGEGEEGGGFDITQTPGYQFRFDEGMNALNRSLAATGNRLSGRAAKAAQRYGQGFASQEFSNRFNRLSALSGRGQTAANQSGAAGMRAAGNIGNALMAGGRAQAAGIAGTNQAIQGGIGNYLSYQQNQNLLNQLGNNQQGLYADPTPGQYGR